MKIEIEALKNAPSEVFTHTFTVDDVALSEDEDDLEVLAPLDVHLKVAYRDGKVEVVGSLCTSVKLTCSRCLQSFSQPFCEEFDDEIPVDEETEIDVSKMTRDILITSLPLKPLCTAECQGICPTCGADRNEKQCGCPVDDTDPRMSVLKKLLDK
ncbi:MAG: DUF177 domain-containing protein [Firmicutes bacterium]|nr:DUF177 domain-containing protein [Bacillota bacterium]